METILIEPEAQAALSSSQMTADDLYKMSHKARRYELLKGELKEMSPAGPRHGRIAMRLGSLIEMHARRNKLGNVYAAETGFKLTRNPDTVRAADASFVARERIPQEGEPEGYWAIAPDLVVEVVSPSDSAQDVHSKVADWLRAGCRLVWVVYPRTRTITEYRSADRIRILSVEEQLTGGDVLPGFSCPVEDVFL